MLTLWFCMIKWGGRGKEICQYKIDKDKLSKVSKNYCGIKEYDRGLRLVWKMNLGGTIQCLLHFLLFLFLHNFQCEVEHLMVLNIWLLLRGIFTQFIQVKAIKFHTFLSVAYSWRKLQCWLKAAVFCLLFLDSLYSTAFCRQESGKCCSFVLFLINFFLIFTFPGFPFTLIILSSELSL